MTITEARYGGTYEGGTFVLVGGLRNPGRVKGAFSGNVECHGFWNRVEEEGPVLTVELDDGHYEDEKEIYIASGPHPVALYEQYHHFLDALDERNHKEVIRETFSNHPELVQTAYMGDEEAQHMLAALAGSRSTSAAARDSMNIVREVLSERFDGPPVREVSDEVIEAALVFVEDENPDGQPPLQYLTASEDYDDLYQS